MSSCSTEKVSLSSQITRFAPSSLASSTAFWISALSTSRTSLPNHLLKRRSHSTLESQVGPCGPRFGGGRRSIAVLKYRAVRILDHEAETFEAAGTQDKGSRPGAVQGGLPPEMDPADGRDARLYHRGDRRFPVGYARGRGVPADGSATLAPAGALGRGRALVDARRRDQVPVQPGPALYRRHGGGAPRKDALLELLPLGALGDRCGRSPEPVGRLPVLRTRARALGLPRRPLARLPRRPLPLRRARRGAHWHPHGGRGARRGVMGCS